MSATSTLAVIPARLGSTRLPRKPLHTIAGRPLIEWVWRRVSEDSLFDSVVVATDSEEIAEVVRGFGGRSELTLPAHVSGTDRVAEVARRSVYASHGVIVNVQGDEPFVRTDHLNAAMRLVSDGGWGVGTIATPLRTLSAWRDPAVVKVVRGADGGAALFSRASIPSVRDGEPSWADLAREPFLRHIGVYAYTREALFRWVDLPEGDLEHFEKLEQLRPLMAGIRIGVEVVGPAEGGIDTPADAERADQLLRQHKTFDRSISYD